jgi:hypothetical protein
MFKKNTSIGFDLKWDRLDDNNYFKKVVKNIYDNVGHYADYAVVINGLPIFFNKIQKSIGISFSGGADSTMLLYLLCRIITEFNLDTKIVAYTIIRSWEKKTRTDEAAENILKYFKKKFPKIKIIKEFGFIPTAFETTPMSVIRDLPQGYFTDNEIKTANTDLYASTEWTKYIANKYEMTMLYNGTTTNPEHLDTNNGAPTFRSIKNSDVFNWDPKKHKTTPFRLINKDWVMAQYINFGLQDLAKLTKSCAASEAQVIEKFGSKITGTDMQKYACGACFFCIERTWAENNTSLYLEENHKSRSRRKSRIKI